MSRKPASLPADVVVAAPQTHDTVTAALNAGLDPIAIIRTARIVPAAAVPMVPSRIRFLDREGKQSLRRVADNDQAEARDAMVEIADNQMSLREDLGKYAPDSAVAREV